MTEQQFIAANQKLERIKLHIANDNLNLRWGFVTPVGLRALHDVYRCQTELKYEFLAQKASWL